MSESPTPRRPRSFTRQTPENSEFSMLVLGLLAGALLVLLMLAVYLLCWTSDLDIRPLVH